MIYLNNFQLRSADSEHDFFMLFDRKCQEFYGIKSLEEARAYLRNKH